MSYVIGNPDSGRLLPQVKLCLRIYSHFSMYRDRLERGRKDYDCNILKSNLFAWPETSTLRDCFPTQDVAFNSLTTGRNVRRLLPAGSGAQNTVDLTVAGPEGGRWACKFLNENSELSTCS